MSRQASANTASLYDRSVLARLRYEAGLTREQLATELGISLRTLQRIETGQTLPRAELAKRIADRFDVTIAYLSLGRPAS